MGKKEPFRRNSDGRYVPYLYGIGTERFCFIPVSNNVPGTYSGTNMRLRIWKEQTIQQPLFIFCRLHPKISAAEYMDQLEDDANGVSKVSIALRWLFTF